MGNPHYLSPCFHIRADGWHVRERPAPTSKRFVADGVLTGPRTVIRPGFGLVEQTTFSAGARLVYFVQTPLLCQTHDEVV